MRHTAENAVALVLFAVLMSAGFSKLYDPGPTAEFLRALVFIDVSAALWLFGLFEIALASWLVSASSSRRLAAGISSAMFAAFLALHVYGVIVGLDAPCGCLGKAGLAIPPEGWIAITATGVVASLWLTGRSSVSSKSSTSEATA